VRTAVPVRSVRTTSPVPKDARDNGRPERQATRPTAGWRVGQAPGAVRGYGGKVKAIPPDAIGTACFPGGCKIDRSEAPRYLVLSVATRLTAWRVHALAILTALTPGRQPGPRAPWYVGFTPRLCHPPKASFHTPLQLPRVFRFNRRTTPGKSGHAELVVEPNSPQ
jgi:hypothetical protein